MLTRRGFLSTGLAAVTLAPLMQGCVFKQPVRFGIHTWIGYESLYLAEHFGWLPPESVLVENQNATESVQMLVKGDVHAACLTLDEVLLVLATGAPVKVALVFNVSAGADVVISRIPISSLAELKGKRIGYEQGALGALVLHNLLLQAQLGLDDVTLVNLSPDQQVDAWEKAQVDVVITYEPTASHLLSDGGIRVYDSRHMPERIFDVLAVRPDLLQRGADRTIQRTIESHFQALDYIRSQRQDALYRIATRQETSFDQVQTALGGIHLPSLQSNRHYLSGEDLRLFDAAKEVESLMLASGLIQSPVVTKSLFDSHWLPYRP